MCGVIMIRLQWSTAGESTSAGPVLLVELLVPNDHGSSSCGSSVPIVAEVRRTSPAMEDVTVVGDMHKFACGIVHV